MTCPKCGHPRALGSPCPVCGDAGGAPAARPVRPVAARPASPASIRAQGASSAGKPRASGGKSRWGVLAVVIFAVVVIAAVGAAAAVLTAGGAAVVEEQAALAATPDRGRDQAAQSLLRNAMTAMDAVMVESGDYTSINQATLEAMEPAIHWVPARSGVCGSPPTGVNAQQNTVAWAGTGRLSYELGTWSESGVQFGVRVNKAGKGTTYYRQGVAGAW